VISIAACNIIVTSPDLPDHKKVNSSRDDIILILLVDYVCYSTITGGSSIVLFDLYVAASECSHFDEV